MRNETLQTLCELVYQLGSDYAIFIPMVNKALTRQNISDARYETLVARLMKNQPLQETDMDEKVADLNRFQSFPSCLRSPFLSDSGNSRALSRMTPRLPSPL